MKLKIIMYHYVRELSLSRYYNIKGLEYQYFKTQIEYLLQNYNIIRMEDLISYYNGIKSLPKNSVLLTFDDGYIDHYTYVFPILQKYKIQGSFFIPSKILVERKVLDVNKIHLILATQNINSIYNDLLNTLNYFRGIEHKFPDNNSLINSYAIENRFDDKETVFVKRILQFVLKDQLRTLVLDTLFKKYFNYIKEEVLANELYLNYDQIKTMKDLGMHIGVHGYSHKWLGKISKQEFKFEIEKSLEIMDDFVDINGWTINYPYGSYSKELLEYLMSTKCKLGFSTEVRTVNLIKDNKFTLPRLDTNDFPPISNNFKML